MHYFPPQVLLALPHFFKGQDTLSNLVFIGIKHLHFLQKLNADS
jgi:hypothetical protein